MYFRRTSHDARYHLFSTRFAIAACSHSFTFRFRFFFCISRKRFVVGSISVPHSLHTLHVVFRDAKHEKPYVNFIRYIPYFSVSFGLSPLPQKPTSTSTHRVRLHRGTCSVRRKFAHPHLLASMCASTVDICTMSCRGNVSYTSHNLDPELQIYSFLSDFYYTYNTLKYVRFVYSGIVCAYRTAGQNANVYLHQFTLQRIGCRMLPTIHSEFSTKSASAVARYTKTKKEKCYK